MKPNDWYVGAFEYGIGSSYDALRAAIARPSGCLMVWTAFDYIAIPPDWTG